MIYKQIRSKYPIQGLLHRTDEKHRLGGSNDKMYHKYTVFVDDAGQKFVKFNGSYWKFPEEVEY